MDFFNCKSLDEAISIIQTYLTGVVNSAEYIELPDLLGRIAAEDVLAAEDIPPFSRSTVDGFAVRSSDTFGAGEANPVWLAVQGEITMGQPPAILLRPGQAAIIPTGGMLPSGADSVVMVEHTEVADAGKTVFVNKPAAPGENVIVRGEDIKNSSIVIAKGQVIDAPRIGALAACGISGISVYRRLRVAVISTGDELVDVLDTPTYGQIRDINSYTIAAALMAAGCEVFRSAIVRDNYQDIFAVLLQAAASYQMVIVSGGSSVGTRDHTVKAIEALGMPGVLFHGVTVKPGKPTIFGMLGRVPVFGLPGHPVSALMIFQQLVQPAVGTMSGLTAPEKRTQRARVTKNIASAPGRDDFVQVRLIRKGEEWEAEPILGKSGLISTMLRADGIIRIDSSKSGLYKDEVVEVILSH